MRPLDVAGEKGGMLSKLSDKERRWATGNNSYIIFLLNKGDPLTGTASLFASNEQPTEQKAVRAGKSNTKKHSQWLETPLFVFSPATYERKDLMLPNLDKD